jgi:hypothetical protein
VIVDHCWKFFPSGSVHVARFLCQQFQPGFLELCFQGTTVYRVLDVQSRSMCDNLIFTNIPEIDEYESPEETENLVKIFVSDILHFITIKVSI